MDVSGKIVIVIGGMGLLGNEICKFLKKEGVITIIADILDKQDPNYVRVNICEDNDILNLINIVKNNYGVIDCVINSTYPRNKSYGTLVDKVTYQSFCENMNIHLGGYFNVCKLFAKFFDEQGHGNIINLSSVYATKTPDFTIYNGTNMTMPVEYSVIKSGINSLTRYMTKYYKKIKFNTVSPGGIYDNQPDNFVTEYNKKCCSKGLLDKKDICGTILFLLSDLSYFIRGQDIIIDDGLSLS